MDERLDALLSITGRMDGYLYRCRNDASYTMLYISDGMLTVSGYPPSDFIHNQVRDYVSAIHPDDLASVYAAVDAALEARCNWNVDYRIVPLMGPPYGSARSAAAFSNEAGELEFLEGFVVDISDRKVVEDINAELLQELKVGQRGALRAEARDRAGKAAERPLGQPRSADRPAQPARLSQRARCDDQSRQQRRHRD